MQLSFSELRKLDGKPISFQARPDVFTKPVDVSLNRDDTFVFITPFLPATKGRVIDVDHGAEFPLKVEWVCTRTKEKRLTSFAPYEFITIKKE